MAIGTVKPETWHDTPGQIVISHLSASHVAAPYDLMAYTGNRVALRITAGGTPDEVTPTLTGT